MVSDIEILFIPRIDREKDPDDLFGQYIDIDYASSSLRILETSGLLKRRKKKNGQETYGEFIKFMRHVPSGIAVDFFACTPESWWTSLVSRTGGKESNERLARAAKGRGFKWRPNGGGFSTRTGEEIVFVVKSEKTAFEFVELPYLRPEFRS